TPFNKTRVAINHYVRNLRGRSRLIQSGDKIISLKNNRSLGLFNGLQGIVTKVRSGRLDFRADNGIEYQAIRFDPNTFGCEKAEFLYYSDLHPFDHANAITCHKAQGSEWNRVMVFPKPCRYWDERRWNYTAASRAKLRLTWVAER